MKPISIAAIAFSVLAAPAFADGHATGDAEAGENVFKKCKSCHAVVDAEGEVIVKGGKTGPNLYGIYGKTAGSDEDFRYGDSLVAAGEAGLAWDQENFVAYVADPKKFLVGYLDDSGAKSRMSYKLRKEQDAVDVWTYLVSVGPEVETDMETEETTESN